MKPTTDSEMKHRHSFTLRYSSRDNDLIFRFIGVQSYKKNKLYSEQHNFKKVTLIKGNNWYTSRNFLLAISAVNITNALGNNTIPERKAVNDADLCNDRINI